MSASTTPELTAAGTPYVPRQAAAVLALLAGMAVMVTYVETMVLPAFKQFLSFYFGTAVTTTDATTVAWILSAYLVVGTVATPIFGKLGDKYGKKRMLMVVMAVYAAAVSVAGFTPDLGNALGIARNNQIYLLIGARAFQGVGMAMFPLAFAMIPETFPAQRVGTAQGLVAAMFAIGAAIGLALGGWVAESFGWQFTYHTIVPFAIGLPVVAAFRLHESPHRHPAPLDLAGIASLGLSLAMFLLGITEGTTWGWTNATAAQFGPIPWGVPEFFAVAVASLAFFLLWEPRAEHPFVSFKAMRERNILVSNVNGLVSGMTMFLSFVTLVLLAEDLFPPGFNLTEFQFGLVALPSALGMLVMGPVLGFASSRLGPKPVMTLGFSLAAAAAIALALFHDSVLELALFAIPLQVGVVGVFIAMTNVIVLTADRRELGVQTGINQTFRTLGTAVGPVLATTIVASFLTPYQVAPLPAPPRYVYANTGFVWVFVVMAVLAALGGVLSLALRNYRFAADGTRTEAGAARRPAPATDAEPVPAQSVTGTR